MSALSSVCGCTKIVCTIINAAAFLFDCLISAHDALSESLPAEIFCLKYSQTTLLYASHGFYHTRFSLENH